MKRTLVLLIFVGILSGMLNAQEVMHPKIIRKAAFADKTPPLREMTAIIPGERKRAWKDGIIGNESIEMQFNNEGLPKNGIYDNLQSIDGQTKSRGPLVNVEGIGNVNGVYPPDTDGDVGPNHYFQMINLSFAIWDKNGNKLYGPVDNSTLWAGFIGPWSGTNDGDPIILYDEDADRWVASQFAIELSNGKSYELVAVSATGDPLGEYYRYAFEFDHFNDYPHMGVWGDGYYCTFNFFSGGFMGSGVAAFEREKMLQGDPDASMVFFGYFENNFSLQASDIDGDLPPEGAPNYVACINAYGNQQLEIYEFHVDWETPANSTYQLGISINPGFFDPDINGVPQPGTSGRLDNLSRMLMYRLAYRNFGTHETMVANHTVNAGGNRAGVKWYELRKEAGNDWYIYQQGVYAPDDGLHRWMGSIAINAEGTIALGYSVGSSTKSASIRYTGRTAEAPPGEMNFEEVEAVSGVGSQSSISRWGDYSNLSVDPADDTTFWFTTEYMRSAWKTKIFSFNFDPLLPPTVDAGEDAMVCQDTIFRAFGNATHAKSHLWTTSGDGILPNPQNLTVVYFRGQQDLQNGEFWLKLTADGYEPGVQTSDSIHVAITRTPVVFAGNDTIIHTSSNYQANAQAENFESLEWMTSGDGNFDDITSLQTIYTPGSMDIANGSVELTLMANPLEPCSFGEDDSFDITLDPTIGINDAFSDVEFSIAPNPSTGKFKVSLDKMNEPAILNLINTAGETIFTEIISTSNYSKEFDLRYQAKGVYLIQISSGNSSVSDKIIIR